MAQDPYWREAERDRRFDEETGSFYEEERRLLRSDAARREEPPFSRRQPASASIPPHAPEARRQDPDFGRGNFRPSRGPGSEGARGAPRGRPEADYGALGASAYGERAPPRGGRGEEEFGIPADYGYTASSAEGDGRSARQAESARGYPQASYGGRPAQGRPEEDWRTERGPGFERHERPGQGRRQPLFGERAPEALRRLDPYADGRSRERGPYAGAEAGNAPGDGEGSRRTFFVQARDEVSAWLGDEEAARRRRRDEGLHRGAGPKDYTRSTDRIREDVCERLSDDPMLDARHIEVTVEGQEVTLDGRVARREDKRRAEDLADRVSGVRHVQNNLRVSDVASGGDRSPAPTTGGALEPASQDLRSQGLREGPSASPPPVAN